MSPKLKLCLALALLSLGCSGNEKESRGSDGVESKSSETASAPDHSSKVHELVRRANDLWEEEGFEEALVLVDRAIEIAGESPPLVDYRCDLLFKLERGQELLEATLLLEEISEKKTPWNYLKIADAHVFLGDGEQALGWMEKAVRERDFRKFTVFDAARYDFIRNDPRFVTLLKEIHDELGIGRAAEDFVVELVQGDELRLSSLEGQVILIDFWATWCPPCLEELPTLEELYGQYHSEGFEIVSIGLDEGEDVERALAFLAKKDLPWNLAVSGQGYEDEVVQRYGVNGLPSTFLIDRNGVLREVLILGDELRRAVDKLIKEPARKM